MTNNEPPQTEPGFFSEGEFNYINIRGEAEQHLDSITF